MSWWDRLFGRGAPVLKKYRVTGTVFSPDGRRAAEIRHFSNNQTYLLESERVGDGEFEPRHGGSLVGPFRSPQKAEAFIVTTHWFRGDGE